MNEKKWTQGYEEGYKAGYKDGKASVPSDRTLVQSALGLLSMRVQTAVRDTQELYEK